MLPLPVHVEEDTEVIFCFRSVIFRTFIKMYFSDHFVHSTIAQKRPKSKSEPH